MSADESWDEDWDDDYEETIFGMPVRTFRISVAAVLAVLLLLVASLVSTSFGLYSGVGSVTIAANYDGFGPLDEELKFKVYLTSPTLGRLATDSGSYAVSYDHEVRAHGSFSYSKAGIGTVTIPVTDFFVANGEYTITVSAGDASDSVSMDISRNADYAIGIVNFFGGTFDDSRYTESFTSDPQVTLSFTDSAGPGTRRRAGVPGRQRLLRYFLLRELGLQQQGQLRRRLRRQLRGQQVGRLLLEQRRDRLFPVRWPLLIRLEW